MHLLPNPGARSIRKLKRTGGASAGPRGCPASPAINSSDLGGDNPIFKNTIFNVYVCFASLQARSEATHKTFLAQKEPEMRKSGWWMEARAQRSGHGEEVGVCRK